MRDLVNVFEADNAEEMISRMRSFEKKRKLIIMQLVDNTHVQSFVKHLGIFVLRDELKKLRELWNRL